MLQMIDPHFAIAEYQHDQSWGQLPQFWAISKFIWLNLVVYDRQGDR